LRKKAVRSASEDEEFIHMRILSYGIAGKLAADKVRAVKQAAIHA
jgi:hypothetical protein